LQYTAPPFGNDVVAPVVYQYSTLFFISFPEFRLPCGDVELVFLRIFSLFFFAKVGVEYNVYFVSVSPLLLSVGEKFAQHLLPLRL
jgi:hypothetical protein